MGQEDSISAIPQYSLGRTLLIWAAAAAPMCVLGWVIAPALAPSSEKPGFIRLAALTVGLIWQFVLVMFLLYRETGTLRWSTLRKRLWLTTPRRPQSGELCGHLWWWLVPVVLLTAAYKMLMSGTVDRLWVAMFPFFAEPQAFSLGAALDTPEAKSQLVGAWGILALFVLSALFNTFLGEELLFRGLLLPRMAGVFGRWDWVMNGLLFGLYHLHQPWTLFSAAIGGMFLYALPSRFFRSSWFGVIAHSGQSIYFAILMLGLVLGLA